MAKGVARDAIDHALDEAGGDSDEDRALELARARSPRVAALSPEQAYSRLVGFLARRGYDPQVARTAARAALEMPPRD